MEYEKGYWRWENLLKDGPAPMNDYVGWLPQSRLEPVSPQSQKGGGRQKESTDCHGGDLMKCD